MSRQEPYSGSEPYVFISYAHKNSDTVLPLIHALQEQDVRIWFDEGIEAGTEWPEYIAKRLENSHCVIAFLSDAFINSQNCRREVNFSIDAKKEIMAVYLEEIVLSAGMQLQLSPVPALHRKDYVTQKAFLDALMGAEAVMRCKIKPRLDLQKDAAALSAEECYENSLRVRKGTGPEAIEAAAEWVRVAALKGHAQACKQMGRLMENSNYKPVGQTEWARRWYVLGEYNRVKSCLLSASASEVDEFEQMVGQQFLSVEDYAKICADIEELLSFLQSYDDKQPGYWTRQKVSSFKNKLGEEELSADRCRQIYEERNRQYCAQLLEWTFLWYEKTKDGQLAYRIGLIYEEGKGIEPDIKKAIRWYQVAAESGDCDAMLKLGLFCETGFGVEQDLTQAFNWYQCAANAKPHSEASYYVYDCYCKGIGVKKSLFNALQWKGKSHNPTVAQWNRKIYLEKYSH